MQKLMVGSFGLAQFQSIPENEFVCFLVSYVIFWDLLGFEIAESEAARIVREFAEILDASEAYHNTVRMSIQGLISKCDFFPCIK